ncbi:MAG TPA: CdvA-like protein [Candidatus Bathyarchaeia archaeon]|nr:CdvA-like protein [Candidatus Bathyarchaeia archaeon]
MSARPTSNLFLYIGKPVKDEYGRQVGKIASFAVTPNGRVNGVFLEHGDGEFQSYPSDQFKMEGEEITLTPSIKIRVKALCDEIPLIWRKDQALNDLVDKKKIPSEMFTELHKNFEGALNQLRTDAQTNLDAIDKQIAKCNSQIRELNSALINIEIEREIGRIDDTAYQTALQMVQDGLKKVNYEKTDLESLRSQLSNLLLGDSTLPWKEPETKTASTPALPEPPVVVHVKSASKTG